MKTQLSKLYERLRSSYWFIPSVMAAGAIGLSYGMVRLDYAVELDVERSFWFYTGHASGALEVLGTIASATITIATLTFSVTIVAMTLAASQYGSRLLYNFMRDRANQVVLGVFVGVFLYSLLVLRRIEGDGVEFVPQLSVTVALLLALGGVAALIYFIHHAAEAIQADVLTAGLRDELSRYVRKSFPPPEQEPECRREAAKAEQLWERLRPSSAVIRSASSGFLQAVDMDDLMQLASEEDLVVRVLKRPGEFVLRESELLAVHPGHRMGPVLCERGNRAFVLGPRRTLIQDVELPVQELVEVAVRGLSPGVYDPFTALRCIARLSDALIEVMGRAEPSGVHRDADGKIRVLLAVSTFASICDAALIELREYGAANTLVMQRLIERLAELVPLTRDETQRAVLGRHAQLIYTAAMARAKDDVGRAGLEQARARFLATARARGGTPVSVCQPAAMER